MCAGGPYVHIACCVDDGPASPRVVSEAAALRALAPGRLTLLHVASPDLLYAGVPTPGMDAPPGAGWLDALAAATPGAEALVLEGYPPARTCEWAAGAGVDLLVAGAHRGGLERLIMGSFAAYVVHHGPCPVLLVRP